MLSEVDAGEFGSVEVEYVFVGDEDFFYRLSEGWFDMLRSDCVF